MAKAQDIPVRCPQCFRSQDNKAQFMNHLVENYQHCYSKAAAMREYKKALAEAQEEQRQEALKALGYKECPNCKKLSDAGLWKPMQFTRLRDRAVCVDCQPVKVLNNIGGIYKSQYNDSGYDYAFVGSDYTSSNYETIEKVERMMRLHVADQTDDVSQIENEEDRKEYYRRQAWQRRMREIMGVGHCDNDARQIEAGLKVCKEHSVCAHERFAA